MSTSPPAPKRRRATRACRLCLSCKTKCDNITELGCRRCREKKRLCSLIDKTNSEDSGRHSPGVVPPPPFPPPVLPVNIVDPAMSNVNARVAKLEQDLDSLTRIAASTASPVWTTPASSSSVPYPVQIPQRMLPLGGERVYPHMSNIIEAVEWDERFYSATHQQDFPDLMRLGMMTADQVDHAYMIFQRKFTNLMALPPYCNLNMESPIRHPFFTLATLAYTRYATAIPLQSLISQSLSTITTGAISVDVIHALFLLALAPISPEAAQRAQPTSGWYLELAHSIGQRLGIEAKVCFALEDPEVLRDEEYTKVLELCLLWENVKAKLNIWSLMLSRRDTLLHSLAHLLPTNHPREAYRNAVAQVQLSVEMSEAFLVFHERMVREETMGATRGPDAEADHRAWEAMESRLDELLLKPTMTNILRCDLECTRQALASRFGAIIRLLPKVLSPAIVRPLLFEIGPILFPALMRMLDSCAKLTDDQIAHLPSYLATHYVFGMVIIRRVMSFVPALKEGEPPRTDHPDIRRLEPVEQRLSKAGPYQALILRKGKEALDRIAILNQGALPGDLANLDPWGGFTFTDLDLSMFDWSTLGVQPGT